MGSGASMPFAQEGSNPGYVAINLRSWDKVIVFYGPPEVHSMMEEIVVDVGGKPQNGKDKCGATQYYLPGRPFMVQGAKSDATIGKVFVTQLLEGMYSLGYDFIVSSDLARTYDQSTMFFKKVCPERAPCRITCVAPGAWDKLILLYYDNDIRNTITACIERYWSNGIQDESDVESLGQRLHKYKLFGNPWFASDKESTEARNLLHKIINKMSMIGWKFHATVNIKGGTDTMFFMKTPHQRISTSVVSLNRTDRIRLIGEMSKNDNVAIAVSNAIVNFWQDGEDPYLCDYYGALEFKLQGHPFHCSGTEAINTRRLICKIFEGLRLCGWTPLTGNDLSRKDHDKSVITMTRCNPANARYACISLSSIDKIRFIGFPSNVLRNLQEVVWNSYSYSIQDERENDIDCYQFKLKGIPWSHCTNYGLHAKSMLLHILKAANRQGWHLVASLDVSAKYVRQKNGPNYPIDVHSWYFTDCLPDLETTGSGNRGRAQPQQSSCQDEVPSGLDYYYYCMQSNNGIPMI